MAVGIDRIGALSKAFEFVYKSEICGEYFEFGVYQGVSISRAIKANTVWKGKTKKAYVERFFGFDSFEGLPVFQSEDHLDDYKVFYEGQFGDTSIEQVRDKIVAEGQSLEGVELFPGLFSDSLTSQHVTDRLDGVRAAIAHIDCDLSSSALDCLGFLDGRLADGTIILFDDWFCYRGRPDRGVNRAFSSWLSQSRYTATEYFNYSWAGKAFILNFNADEY